MIWFRCSSVLASLSLLVGLLALPAAWSGTAFSVMWYPGGVALGIRLDPLAAMLMAFVGLLGWVVSRYSATNLSGRQHGGRAGIALLASIASLLLTVTGASVIIIALGWTLSGLSVAGLVERAGTSNARSAARTMRRTLVIGDAFLWGGVLVGLLTLPSLERARLLEIEPGWGATLTAGLLLGACVARTGLVPAHRWLPETTEAPSPVSALLHAGVVNGAGVLVLLAWPLFAAAPPVLLSLVVLGCASVVVGAWASRVRTDVKGRLACSTTSQMGYMCIQLGLGLPVAALLHLMGHGAYKSWLFLRAGGAIGRARAVSAPRRAAATMRWGGALLAGGLGVVVGLPATQQLVQAAGVTMILPVGLSTCAAALAGYAVAGVRRLPPVMRWGVTATAGVMAGLYTWLLLGAEKVLALLWLPGALWNPVAGAALVLLVAVVLVATHLGHQHLEAHPTSALAVALLPTALAPRSRQKSRGVHLPLPEPATAVPAMEEAALVSTILLAASAVGPAWPLRNFVAANTLARLRSLSFDDALLVAEQAHGVAPRPSLRYFLDLHDAGRVTNQHLQAALAETGDHHAPVDDFVLRAHALAAIPAEPRATETSASGSRSRHFLRRCEAFPGHRAEEVAGLVDTHAALWVQRAWHNASTLYDVENPNGEPAGGPWQLWRRSASRPGYDRAVGIRGASALLGLLPAEPARAISVMSGWLGLTDEALLAYLIATFASAPGWSGHAAWRADRLKDTAPLVEIAALRMAHDILFSTAASLGPAGSPELADGTRAWPVSLGHSDGRDRQALTQQLRTWQRALEMGIEDWLVTDVVLRDAHPRPMGGAATGRPESQSIWCIDVRSERVRRQLEEVGHHHTYGFAGFFGAAVQHIDPEGTAHELCPALITPAFTARERESPLTVRQALYRTLTEVSKNPLGALLVAEAGGGLAALASTVSTLAPRLMRRVLGSWTHPVPRAGEGTHRRPELHTNLDLDARVAMAAASLVSTGLIRDFAPVIVICAHASSPENNAFATAYDCGACGGNHGVVNAVLVADALNDTAVRERLAMRGLVLPRDTVAVAAVHDTTTDVVELLTQAGLPTEMEVRVAAVAADFRTAGAQAARARRRLLPARGHLADAQPLARRAADWSEPTPEWGLAGNAAILIGPRSLTVGSDLQGRVFLHSYERDTDPDAAVLEQLLTAPLVVAQWINAQYYFSAVAPTVMGAGDKTTHNVVGDVGVIRGAHGDLRTGLPWQALFHHEPGTHPDAASLVHAPVRLLGVVVADPAAILEIVCRHEELGQLVSNEWIHLVCVDRGRALRLRPDLGWQVM